MFEISIGLASLLILWLVLLWFCVRCDNKERARGWVARPSTYTTTGSGSRNSVQPRSRRSEFRETAKANL